MSETRRDADFLGDILEAIQRIQSYTKALTWEEFLKDYKTQDAVVRNLEIIGEAVKNLSLEFTRGYPLIPWKDLSGVRDKLIHHYFGVNYEIVWQIVREDLPPLSRQIEEITGS